ncbi:TonB-dependent receptor [Pseudofulvibacter geojedonensis]|uniref:TonB-dependent receptor n=1 Tax=Pseudofulvibacter geojedonensis TaxID=1123758 RepID=A0ABW3HZC9_9FLAO
MTIKLKGDKQIENVPSLASKALRINLNDNIYGTFAEIGAGQETVRNFFRAGGASGTIAKAMSAYDKDFSDAIYGIEDDRRYVTEARLKKMLDHEMNLLEERISRDKHPNKLFFSYANTVATIDFAKKYKGHGWVGIRFQIDPNEDFSNIILHVRFKENDARLQQNTLGALGTNLIHGAFYKHNNPKKLVEYLYDHLDKDQIEIDMVNFSGPRFKNVDNRLMSLQLVKHGMTDAVMFGPDGNNLLAAKILYKKNILALRGSFRPVTKVNMDMFKKSYDMFIKESKVDEERTKVIFEITLSNLKDGSEEIDERDFLDRAELLCSLGHTVMISNFKEYYKVAQYFNNYTKKRIGLALGGKNLVELFDERYYRDLPGGILEAFGKLATSDLRVFVYPFKNKENELMTTENIKVHPRMKDLYKFFKYNGKMVDIKNADTSVLDIYSRKVLKMISEGEPGWEEMLPNGIAELIKKHSLFNCEAEEDIVSL